MKRDSVSAYVHKRHDTQFPMYVPAHILDDLSNPGPPPFPQLRMYEMDGLFLNQKTNKNFRISYSRKSKNLKKIYLQKNK